MGKRSFSSKTEGFSYLLRSNAGFSLLTGWGKNEILNLEQNFVLRPVNIRDKRSPDCKEGFGLNSGASKEARTKERRIYLLSHVQGFLRSKNTS